MFLPYFLCLHHHQRRIRQLSAPLNTSSWRQCPGIRCHPRQTKYKLWKLSADSGANGFASIQDEPNADYDNCRSCLRLQIDGEAPDKYTIPSWQCPSFVVLSQSRQMNAMGSYTEGTYWYTREGTTTSLFLWQHFCHKLVSLSPRTQTNLSVTLLPPIRTMFHHRHQNALSTSLCGTLTSVQSEEMYWKFQWLDCICLMFYSIWFGYFIQFSTLGFHFLLETFRQLLVLLNCICLIITPVLNWFFEFI